MGKTLTALNADPGIEIAVVVAIEGYPDLITSGAPAAALTAWAGTDFAACLGGLTVRWEQGATLDQWKPFNDPALLTFTVVPATDSAGALVDTFGVAVAKRTPAQETRLVTAIDCDDTAIVVKRADDFAASGDLYMGPETIAYSSRDTGTDTFTVSTRGKYSPCTVSGGGRFAHTHKPVEVDAQSVISIPPVVASGPITWIGRWVEVWIHRVVGGVFDVKAEAHRAFVGTIADVAEGDNGETSVSLESVQRRIYESTIFREPFRGQLTDGLFISAGSRFSLKTARQVSGGGTNEEEADDLVVVLSGAATTNEIDAGVYTCTELADLINRWLAAETANGRALFNVRYNAAANTANGLRGVLTHNDPTGTANLTRRTDLTCSTLEPFLYLGWTYGTTTITITSHLADGASTSPNAPRRFAYLGTHSGNIDIVRQAGTYYDQSSLLPAALQSPTGYWTGVLKFGDLGYVKASDVGGGRFAIDTAGLDGFLPTAGLIDQLATMTIEDDTAIEVQQVIIAEATFNNLLLKILLSTGTSGFNHATYDVLPEGLGCAIPYSILGADFLIDMLRLDGGGRSLCAIIDKPTRFVDLFESDFLLRQCFFVWGAGRLQLKGWSTPTAAQATITLDDTNKAVPAATADGDLQRATKTEDDGSLYNIVKVRTSRRSDGEYAEELVIIDANSVRDHGARTRTIDARNTSGPAGGPVAVDVRALLETFRRGFTLFSRPFWRIKRTIARTMFEQAHPGTVAIVTDRYLRDPVTGLRYSHVTGVGGVLNHAALVIGQDHDFGGPDSDEGGEVELMLIPRTSTGVYCPAALVDETQANAGYDAGNAQLTVYAHAYSESGDQVDASRFVAPYLIRITEIDPAVAGSALSWNRVVSNVTGNVIKLTAALSSPAWDAALRYRITFQAYTACTATQQAHAFQADDADGLVADSRQPYEMIRTAGGQSASYTLSAATEPPARYSTNQVGDGVALDVGGEFDISRLANHLIHCKTPPQSPRAYSELRSARTPSGTLELVETFPVFVGMGTFQIWQTRKLYIAPYFRSTTGATAIVVVTLSRFMPNASTRTDVSFVGPVEQHQFSTTSTTFAIPAAYGFPTRHLKLTDGPLGGVGFISIEVGANCETGGLGRRYVGPVE